LNVSLLQIEPTTRCNYTCGFCCGRHMAQEDLSYETFEAALGAFPDLRHVEVQGEGEPLLHPRFFDMLALARGRGIRVSFITNGSYLVPEIAAKILDAGVNKISVSIESADPATFRAIRGGILEKVTRNLEGMIAERARRGLDRPVVGFSITVLKSTRDHLGAILALYRQLGLDGGITLNPLQGMGVYTQHYDESLKREILSHAEAEELWLRMFSDADVRRIQDSRGPIEGFYDELMAGWRPAGRTCPWLEQGVYVDRNGHATACCMVKDTARHSLGRVGIDDPAKIEAARERMRAQLAGGEAPAPCVDCDLAHYALMSKTGLARFGAKGIWNRLFRSRSRETPDELVSSPPR
jgi:MoaA/NifB/PqqE/SkfB family radical SAM enzyme